jgi:hypothetical protein
MRKHSKRASFLALAALLLSGFGAAVAQQVTHCPAGTHPNKQSPMGGCLKDDFVGGVGNLNAPSQKKELKAWEDHDKAEREWDAAYSQKQSEERAADNIKCSGYGGFSDCHSANSRKASHERAADRAEDHMDDAKKACETANKMILQAREEEKREGVSSVSTRNQGCKGEPMGGVKHHGPHHN